MSTVRLSSLTQKYDWLSDSVTSKVGSTIKKTQNKNCKTADDIIRRAKNLIG